MTECCKANGPDSKCFCPKERRNALWQGQCILSHASNTDYKGENAVGIRRVTGLLVEELSKVATFEGIRELSEERRLALVGHEKDIEHLRATLRNCLGCVTAAEAEGLQEAIAALRGNDELTDRLIDLIERRLLWVRTYIEESHAI